MNDLEMITVADLPIEITRKRGIKNLYIRVHPPDGKITVNAPSNMPTQKISLFVLKKVSCDRKSAPKNSFAKPSKCAGMYIGRYFLFVGQTLRASSNFCEEQAKTHHVSR